MHSVADAAAVAEQIGASHPKGHSDCTLHFWHSPKAEPKAEPEAEPKAEPEAEPKAEATREYPSAQMTSQ